MGGVRWVLLHGEVKNEIAQPSGRLNESGLFCDLEESGGEVMMDCVSNYGLILK